MSSTVFTRDIKLVAVGNSRGVRLPRELLRKYGISDVLVLEERPDAMNQRIDTVVICPLTSQLHPHWASRVGCECEGRPAEVAVDQIRTISKSRLGNSLGKIDALTAAEVRSVIRLLYAEI